MEVIKYEKPVIKRAAEMQAGDIFRTEYGDFGNWVEAVFIRATPSENHTHITCRWITSENAFTMVSLERFEDATFEVVGKVV